MDDKIQRIAQSDLLMFRATPAEAERAGRGLTPPTREIARLEQRLQSAARYGLPSTTSLPLGTVMACPQCGTERTIRQTAPNCAGRTARYWSECACVVAASERTKLHSREGVLLARGSSDERDASPNAYDVAALAEARVLTLDTFEPTRLADRYVYDAALKWLADILERQVVGAYRAGPPAALYFQGERGRGKTHLAVALMLAARDADHRVAILNEKKYLHQARTVPFGPPLEALVADPGERAWLTIIDDIGKHRPENEGDRARVQNAWYSVLDRRYNARRWMVLTSEKTLDELVAQGTLDNALYSRLYEMTRGIHLVFAGEDQRLKT